MHLDGAHDAAHLSLTLEGVLQGECVHHRGKHADVVGLGAVHALGRAGKAAEDVAAAHGDGDLDALAHDLGDLAGDSLGDLGVDAIAHIAHQELAGELEQDAFVLDVRHFASLEAWSLSDGCHISKKAPA